MDVTAELTLTAGAQIEPSPTTSFGVILTFGKESFSAAVMPDGSGELQVLIPRRVALRFLFEEAASPFLKAGNRFSFFECGRVGEGRIL